MLGDEVRHLRWALTTALDRCEEWQEEAERRASIACAWAWDKGTALRDVRCYWCDERLGDDGDAIRAHVATCRQGAAALATETERLADVLALRDAQLSAARDTLTRWRSMLEFFARLEEGEEVTPAFDSPVVARYARVVLAAEWSGPCFHGRDPWDRCETCEEAGRLRAWARARRAEIGFGCAHPTWRLDEGGEACETCGYWRHGR